MTISQDTLRSYSQTVQKSTRDRLITEARTKGRLTGFLCHSHKDRTLAQGVQQWFKTNGCEIYIDWQDEELPSRPSKVTAKKIQRKIRETDRFLYLATKNSSESKWCPWEIGYADGQKSPNDIIIIPTSNNYGSYGQEYLDLYKHIHSAKGGGNLLFEAGMDTGGRQLSSAL